MLGHSTPRSCLLIMIVLLLCLRPVPACALPQDPDQEVGAQNQEADPNSPHLLGPVSGQPLVMATEDERMVRWDLTADSLTMFSGIEVMEASGNVLLTRGDDYLKADFARYYMATNWVFLRGNVVVRSRQDEILAEEAEFDLRSRTGWLRNGRIFMSGPHTYISGEHITKHWGDVYTFRNATITSCDGDIPAWSMTAEKAVVEIDGYARLTRSSFQVRDTPIAFTPFFVFPVKTNRQTGLLRPDFGHSNTKGFFYNQPFFWAIDESRDLTVNTHFMETRGLMYGMEYRARPAVDATVWLRADWLRDEKRKMHQWEGPYAWDGLVRHNRERYWLRGMVDTRLADPAWRFRADLDYVSDQYFLSEFKSDFSGFNRSRNELDTLFSRSLQERDLKRQSAFLLTRDWERVSIAASSSYLQNQYLRNGNAPLSSDKTVQRLPQFDAFLHRGRIFSGLPLEIDAAFQAAYMYRRSGTSGGRYEVVPTLTLPVNTRYGSIIADVGLTQTMYETERASRSLGEEHIHGVENDKNRPRQSKDSRNVPQAGIAGFTEFARIFNFSAAPLAATKENVGQSRWLAMRHSIQPRLEFRYRANRDQERTPYYSTEDRLPPRTELVYSVTNMLTAKRDHVALVRDPESDELVPTLRTSYRSILSLRLEQAYDYREAVRNNDRDSYPRRPFGDVFSDLTVYLTDHLSVSTRNDWSPYKGDFTRHQSAVALSIPEYGQVSVGYDMRKIIREYTRRNDARVNYLRLGASTASFGPWSLHGSYRQDFRNHRNREMDFNLIYTHQCFQLVGRVNIEPQETSYHVYIMLTGLGN